MKKKSSDSLDLPVVEVLRPWESGLHHMHHAHHDRDTAGPFVALSYGEDLAAMLTDPAQAGGAGVPLTDRVCCDEPEGAFFADEIEAPAEKMGHQVGVAVALHVRVL